MEKAEFSLKDISSLKTIAMILVLIYHAVALWLPDGWFNQKPVDDSMVFTYLSEWLNMVHIYIFVFASGYIYRTLKIKEGKYTSFKELIQKKSKRLLLPYVLTCCIWVIPFFVIFYQPTYKEIFVNYVLAYRPSQLWFLLMLFWVFILGFWTINYVEEATIWKLFFVGGVVYISYYLASYVVILPFQLLTAVKYLPFFWLGMSFDRYKIKICSINIYVCLLGNILLYILYLALEQNDLIEYKLGMLFTQFVIHIGGIFLFILVEFKSKKLLENSKIWNYIGNKSFYIYLFHQQIIWLCVSKLNGNVRPVLFVIINVVVSLIVSLLLAEVTTIIKNGAMILCK